MARTDDGVSAPVTVKVSAVVKSFKISAPGRREVVLGATGAPSGTFASYRDGAAIGSDKGTSAKLTRTVPKGKAKFSVRLTATDTVTSPTRTVTAWAR